MAGGAEQDDDDIISGINVTPLVDIMLVLLIIVMVTSTVWPVDGSRSERLLTMAPSSSVWSSCG